MLNAANLGLVGFLILGLLARSNLLAAAAAVLLSLRLTGLGFILPRLYRPSMDVGLLLLTVAMLVPFALGKVKLRDIAKSFASLPGLVAIVGAALATHLNAHGIHIYEQSHLMISLIVGSIIGIVLLGGMPVGPLTAAGVTYLMLEAVTYISQWFK
ncbi:DUF441 domain-containing protein [Sulfobacillus harzensis]|uniref:UPF0756 membrane protein HIJ39_17525 n=1 Tax=Sulfobacillus harzensis TaxID=2729629 RepID=A0A7Y0L808_9FIRM|nr:DUF441 family protein [Sulfobacillus harzensis]NMP24135.1 DUF441 domain-containing protein [Sulfobacillus harzensis]